MTDLQTYEVSTSRPAHGSRLLGGERRLAVSPIALGAIPFGSSVDEERSFAILDRFVELGGTFIDTSNNYSFWLGDADSSERTLGRWLAARPGLRDQLVLATKVGARPRVPGAGLENVEGLSAPVVSAAVRDSLRRLGTDRIDVYYSHVEDRSVPVEETVGAFGEQVAAGLVRLVGVSNHPTWRIEQARQIARAQGVEPYTAIQLRYSYLQPRPEAPLVESGHRKAGPEVLDYVESEPDLTLIAYSTLLSGAYARPERPLQPAYDHPGTASRLAALRSVADETGATVNQVVLAWLMQRDRPIVPIVGATSTAQVDEAMAARDVVLDDELLAQLNAA